MYNNRLLLCTIDTNNNAPRDAAMSAAHGKASLLLKPTIDD